MKRKVLLSLFAVVFGACTTDMQESIQQENQSKELEQRSYTKEFLPFKKEEIHKLVELANQKSINSQHHSDGFSALVKPNTLSLAEEVVENRKGQNVTYSIGLKQAYPSEKEFKNLVINKNGTREIIYLVTYYPSDTYHNLQEQGYTDVPFDGDYKLELLHFSDQELVKTTGNSPYTVCITTKVFRRCTAGGKHTMTQYHICKGAPNQKPRVEATTHCTTFFNRDRNGLTRPVPDSERVYPNKPIYFDSNGGKSDDNTPSDKYTKEIIPKYECLNADCSQLRAIDPIEVTPITAVPIVIDELNNDCAKSILAQMRNTIQMKSSLETPNLQGQPLTFSEMIIDLFEKSTRTNLTFKEGKTPDNANASTQGTTITLNGQYLKTATQLAIARTMIHEMVHAYLNATRGNKYGFRNQDFQKLLNNYFNSNAEKYPKDSDLLNRLHHEFMGNYVEQMALSLQQWDMHYGTKTDLGIDYYKALSYAGFVYKKKDADGEYVKDINGNIIYEDTDSFKKLVPKEKDREDIKKIIQNEQKSNKKSKGSKCP